MLEIGSKAPSMALEDTNGQVVTLGDFHAKRGVLMFFMRSASCPVCNMHVKDLIRRADQYRAADVQVIIAVPDERADAAKWKEKNGIPFPVVTGRRGSIYESIGLSKKIFGSMQQSGSIVIDSRGVIRHAHGATMPINSYDKKGIAAALEDLHAPVD